MVAVAPSSAPRIGSQEGATSTDLVTDTTMATAMASWHPLAEQDMRQ